MTYLDYPFSVSAQGRTATTEHDEHIRDLIEQVLLTAPGERVNRPDFGTELPQLLFAPVDDEVATAVQFMVQAALQKWLGDLIQIESVEIRHHDAQVRVAVSYVVLRNQQRQVAEITRAVMV